MLNSFEIQKENTVENIDNFFQILLITNKINSYSLIITHMDLFLLFSQKKTLDKKEKQAVLQRIFLRL